MDRCRHGGDEDVANFYARFLKIYVDCSGLGEAPDYMKEATAPLWEQHFRNLLLLVLRLEIVNGIKHTFVGWNEARLDTIHKYTVHIDETDWVTHHNYTH